MSADDMWCKTSCLLISTVLHKGASSASESCFAQSMRSLPLFSFLCISVLYRTCFEMVADRQCSSLQSSKEKDFEGGVHLGIGGFNLVSALFELQVLSDSEYLVRIFKTSR